MNNPETRLIAMAALLVVTVMTAVARVALAAYQVKGVNRKETAALVDIGAAIDAYGVALLVAGRMIAPDNASHEPHSASHEIDSTIGLDDAPELAALANLTAEFFDARQAGAAAER